VRERFLLVTNIFPPEIGGPATFIDSLAHSLHAAGVEVTVLCATPAGGEDNRQRPFRVVRAASTRSWIHHQAGVGLALLREVPRASMVLANGLDYQTAAVCRLLRKRYVVKVVGDTVWETARNLGLTTADIDSFQLLPGDPPGLSAHRQRRRYVLEKTAQVVVPSLYLSRLVVGWGVPETRISVVANGVGNDSFTAPPSVRSRGETLRICFAGRLANWKGLDVLLLALARLEGCRLEVLGVGPELPAMVDLATRLGLGERVDFVGRVGHHQMKVRLRQAHVLALPSLYEGLSHTLLEAGAAGLACVASDRGGNPEVITDGRDGYLVDPFDVDGWVARLAELRDEDARRRELGSALQEEVRRRFPLARTMEGTVAVLRAAGEHG
jgi:glycosyltransferase involved in cell wall biosynthesis